MNINIANDKTKTAQIFEVKNRSRKLVLHITAHSADDAAKEALKHFHHKSTLTVKTLGNLCKDGSIKQ